MIKGIKIMQTEYHKTVIKGKNGKPRVVFMKGEECVYGAGILLMSSDNTCYMVCEFDPNTKTLVYSDPGGKSELEDSSPLATAVREFKEEAGVSPFDFKPKLKDIIYHNTYIVYIYSIPEKLCIGNGKWIQYKELKLHEVRNRIHHLM